VRLLENDGLVFDEAHHIYTLNGIVLPSVTQIMTPLRESNYGGIPEYVLQRAADRGTAVHQAIDIYLDYGVIDIDPRYSEYVDAFLKWMGEVNPTIIATEQAIYHPSMMYCGTADCVCEIGGKTVLIDYKTTSTVHDKLVRVQLQAYESALVEHGIKIEEKRILQLKSGGEYAEYIYPAMDTEAWRVFTALKTVHDYINK